MQKKCFNFRLIQNARFPNEFVLEKKKKNPKAIGEKMKRDNNC